jgi:hypothetical protein
MVIKRRSDRTLIFTDHPEFRPNLTPQEMFRHGIFGGTYFRKIYSSVTKKSYSDVHKKYSFLRNMNTNLLTRDTEDLSLNKFGVHSGTSLEYWEAKHWIQAQDPYGWVQWYCEFYSGRRSKDDVRQIKRWAGFTGPSGRFRTRLVNMCKAAKKKITDPSVSPVIRQGMLQWAFMF